MYYIQKPWEVRPCLLLQTFWQPVSLWRNGNISTLLENSETFYWCLILKPLLSVSVLNIAEMYRNTVRLFGDQTSRDCLKLKPLSNVCCLQTSYRCFIFVLLQNDLNNSSNVSATVECAPIDKSLFIYWVSYLFLFLLKRALIAELDHMKQCWNFKKKSTKSFRKSINITIKSINHRENKT